MHKKYVRLLAVAATAVPLGLIQAPETCTKKPLANKSADVATPLNDTEGARPDVWFSFNKPPREW